MSLEMLGIPNCNTIKKAKTYLEQKGVTYSFRDVRKNPLSQEEWASLVDQDVEGKLINTKSPSFRKAGVSKDDLNRESKIEVLKNHPTAMKRPTMVKDGKLAISGFSESAFDSFS